MGEDEEETPVSDADGTAAPEPKPLIGVRGLTALTAAACTCLIAFGCYRANAKRLVPQSVPPLNATMMLPADWRPGKAVGGPSAIFISRGQNLNSTLEIGTLPSNPEGVEALAIALAKTCESKQVLPKFATQNILRWREMPGKPAAIYFRFTIKVGEIEMPRFGVTALVPRDDGKTEYLTICCFADESDERIGDLKRILQAQASSSNRLLGK